MTFSRKNTRVCKCIFYAARKTLFAMSVAKTTRRYDIRSYAHISQTGSPRLQICAYTSATIRLYMRKRAYVKTDACAYIRIFFRTKRKSEKRRRANRRATKKPRTIFRARFARFFFHTVFTSPHQKFDGCSSRASVPPGLSVLLGSKCFLRVLSTSSDAVPIEPSRYGANSLPMP